MSDKKERMSKMQAARVWYLQNFPGKTKFHLAESQTEINSTGPMDFYTDGMPKFYAPLAAIVACAAYFFFIFYMNRLCDEAIMVMDLDLLGKLNITAFIAAGGALMVLGYMMLYLQTGTFTSCLTQIEPCIWRDLFKKRTFWTAFRVLGRKRHYPRKRVQRLRNGETVRDAIIEEDAKDEPPAEQEEYLDAFDSLQSLFPDPETPLPTPAPLEIEDWAEEDLKE